MKCSPLGPAIKSALRTVLGSALTVDAPSHALALAMAVPTLMSVEPSAEQNGVMMNQDANTTALLASNTKRRGCKVYVYQVTTQTGNQIDNRNPAVREAGPIDLASTQNLSLFTSLKDFTTFFRGTSLDPAPPVASKQKEIRYFHIHEHDRLDEAQFASWVKQASQLPGERM